MDAVLVTNSAIGCVSTHPDHSLPADWKTLRLRNTGCAFIDYVPQLRVWVDLGYRQSEILTRAVANTPTVWQANLSQIQSARIDITIRREGNGTINGTSVTDHWQPGRFSLDACVSTIVPFAGKSLPVCSALKA